MLGRTFRLSEKDEPDLHFSEWGHASLTCLLIHGFGDCGDVWADLLSALPSQYKALAIDLRGHGESGWASRAEYSVAAHVRDVVRVIRARDLNRFAIIGHSMGANIAMHLGLLFPKELTGLVLIDYGPKLNQVGVREVRERFSTAHRKYETISEYVSLLEERLPLARRDVLDRFASSTLRECAQGGFELKSDPAMGGADDTRRDAEAWSMLGKLTCPVLVVRGSASAVLSSETARRMVQVLPRGRLASVPMAGHAVMLDNPEGFVDAVEPFLGRIVE